MIELVNLSKTYPDGKVAVDHLNYKIESGIVSIIGRNGAGKTTLLRMLSTQLKPSSGDALIDGISIVHETDKIRKKIVSIPQEASPIGILTAYEQVNMFLTARGFSFHEAKISAINALKAVGLDAMHKPTDTLSGGMKRKMFVAIALAANADTVFLDEPTTGLDPLSRFEVWSAIKKLSGNVILTTHYMEEAEELSKKIYMMESGKIIKSGSVEELISEMKNLARIESYKPMENSHKIGSMYIKYVDKSEAYKYIKMDYNVKPVSIEDLFIMRGVDLES